MKNAMRSTQYGGFEKASFQILGTEAKGMSKDGAHEMSS